MPAPMMPRTNVRVRITRHTEKKVLKKPVQKTSVGKLTQAKKVMLRRRLAKIRQQNQNIASKRRTY